jgi:hypothetical protein
VIDRAFYYFFFFKKKRGGWRVPEASRIAWRLSRVDDLVFPDGDEKK